ncbi:phage tail assembly protein [Leptolyngbya sp. 7M]|uniref:phage tail assembly protein n=1 Tax=Leptolyngbya sp. 7M TaxID=2812896 RepID=UPI0021F240BF|nr:phage tail assembly protein [Leptolyngbya sp. 7M]
MINVMIQTEYEFTLPTGYIDATGTLHREGTMRLATTADEILPLKDPRVQSNSAYLIVILLSRVIVRLGTVEAINPKVIEGLFASDLAYLQDLYNRINGNGVRSLPVTCPHCQQSFAVELDLAGEF